MWGGTFVGLVCRKGMFVGRVRATALSRVMERRVMGKAIVVLGPTVLILILPALITETDRAAAQLFSFHVHGNGM